MSFAQAFAGDILDLLLNGTAISNIADDAGTAPLTDLWISLHTADPTETGNQTSSESAYTSYARQSVARSTGWTISTDEATLAANLDFPEATGGTETITHFAIGTDETGTGTLIASGTVSPNISVSTGVIPRLTTGTTLTLS